MKMTRRRWREMAKEVQALAKKDTINAIKLLRVLTDCGLAEAWHAVQKLKTLDDIKLK